MCTLNFSFKMATYAMPTLTKKKDFNPKKCGVGSSDVPRGAQARGWPLLHFADGAYPASGCFFELKQRIYSDLAAEMSLDTILLQIHRLFLSPKSPLPLCRRGDLLRLRWEKAALVSPTNIRLVDPNRHWQTFWTWCF